MRVALTKAAVSGLPGGAALRPLVAAAPTAVGAATAGAVPVGAAEDDEAPPVWHADAVGTPTVAPRDPECPRRPLRNTFGRGGWSSHLVSEES